MASDDLKARQRDVLTARALSLAQRTGTPYDNSGQSYETLSSSRTSLATLQSRLTQLTQSQLDSGARSGTSAVVIGEQYLVFWLLGCECALKAEHIQGVERLGDVTPVPNVGPWMRGVINLRGSIASVVDLRAFLEREPLSYNPRTRLLSVDYNEMVICLIVDGVSDMVPIADSAITNANVRQTSIPQWAIPYAVGSALLDTRAIVLLDAARLLFSEKMQCYETLA